MFTAEDLVGAVLGTFFATIFVAGVSALFVYCFYVRPKILRGRVNRRRGGSCPEDPSNHAANGVTVTEGQIPQSHISQGQTSQGHISQGKNFQGQIFQGQISEGQPRRAIGVNRDRIDENLNVAISQGRQGRPEDEVLYSKVDTDRTKNSIKGGNGAGLVNPFIHRNDETNSPHNTADDKSRDNSSQNNTTENKSRDNSSQNNTPNDKSRDNSSQNNTTDDKSRDNSSQNNTTDNKSRDDSSHNNTTDNKSRDDSSHNNTTDNKSRDNSSHDIDYKRDVNGDPIDDVIDNLSSDNRFDSPTDLSDNRSVIDNSQRRNNREEVIDLRTSSDNEFIADNADNVSTRDFSDTNLNPSISEITNLRGLSIAADDGRNDRSAIDNNSFLGHRDLDSRDRENPGRRDVGGEKTDGEKRKRIAEFTRVGNFDGGNSDAGKTRVNDENYSLVGGEWVEPKMEDVSRGSASRGGVAYYVNFGNEM